jgi:2-keto-4-pentenoate hydratase/2-oxohepta-3-ene-1,7-dioic acid hydratase in catechol pathway
MPRDQRAKLYGYYRSTAAYRVRIALGLRGLNVSNEFIHLRNGEQISTDQDPIPLPYLRQSGSNNYDVNLDVTLRAADIGDAQRICRTNFKCTYWSSVQQLVHHASSGWSLNVGDLMGSGAIRGHLGRTSAVVCWS